MYFFFFLFAYHQVDFTMTLFSHLIRLKMESKSMLILIAVITFVSSTEMLLKPSDVAVKRFNSHNIFLRRCIGDYLSSRKFCKLSVEEKRDKCFDLIRLKHGKSAEPYMPYDDYGIIPFACQQYNVKNVSIIVKIRMYLCPGYKILVENFVTISKPFFVSKGDVSGSVFTYEYAQNGNVEITDLAENVMLKE